jgi:DNA-binding NarL/FixJ family response regulator
MSRALKSEGIIIVGEAGNGKELLDLLEISKPAVVLLDISMPVMDGHDALIIIKMKYPKQRVIVCSEYDEARLAFAYRRSGANAFLSKGASIKTIAETIRLIANSPPEYCQIPKKLSSMLTRCDEEIIPSLFKGESEKVIVAELHITKKGVQGRKKRLFEKTGVKNLAQFVAYIGKNGLNFFKGNSKPFFR